MMKRTITVLTGVVALLVGLSLAPAVSAADPPPLSLVLTGSVTDAPDNWCQTWARDTFTRVTTITESETEDTYDIRQDITGTWASTENAAINGTITGFVEYTVTGTLVENPDAVDDDEDLSSYPCKSDVPDGPLKSTKWALRYFQENAVVGQLTDWEYTYESDCKGPFVEPTDGDVGANIFTKVCWTPVKPPTADIVNPSWVCEEDGWSLKPGYFTLLEAEGIQYNLVGDGHSWLNSVTTKTAPDDSVFVWLWAASGYVIIGDKFIDYPVPSTPKPETGCPAATSTATADPTESASADPTESVSATASASPSSVTTTVSASTTPVSASLPVTGDSSGFVQKMLLTGGGLIAIGAVLLILNLRRRNQDNAEQHV